MKLINYKRGYIEKFDCVIHGTIKMSLKEFDKVLSYLKFNKAKLWNDKVFEEDFKRRIYFNNGKKFLINFRTTATKLIADKWNLTNYKAGNYMLEVSI